MITCTVQVLKVKFLNTSYAVLSSYCIKDDSVDYSSTSSSSMSTTPPTTTIATKISTCTINDTKQSAIIGHDNTDDDDDDDDDDVNGNNQTGRTGITPTITRIENSLAGERCIIAIHDVNDCNMIRQALNRCLVTKSGTENQMSTMNGTSTIMEQQQQQESTTRMKHINDTTKWLCISSMLTESNNNNNSNKYLVVVLQTNTIQTTVNRNRHGQILLECSSVLQIGTTQSLSRCSSIIDFFNIDNDRCNSNDNELLKQHQFDNNNSNRRQILDQCTTGYNSNNNNNNEYNNEKKLTNELSLTSTDPCCRQSIIFHNKIERHRLFVKWIIEQYGYEYLTSTGSGIVDVAGGNGELIRAFIEAGITKITLLDPNPRLTTNVLDAIGSGTEKMDIKIIKQELIGTGLNLLTNDTVSGNEQYTIQNCCIIVGMHPDQATESIIRLANHLHVPFAIVPCCVMPKLFPHRKQPNTNIPIRSYNTFCQYLLDMGTNEYYDNTINQLGQFHKDYLPFWGRNTVIYSKKL